MSMGKMKIEIALIVGIVFFCCWCAYIIIKMIMTQENPHHPPNPNPHQHQYELNRNQLLHHQPFQHQHSIGGGGAATTLNSLDDPINQNLNYQAPYSPLSSSVMPMPATSTSKTMNQSNFNRYQPIKQQQDYYATANNIAQQHQQLPFRPMSPYRDRYEQNQQQHQTSNGLAQILLDSQRPRLAEATSPRWHAVHPGTGSSMQTGNNPTGQHAPQLQQQSRYAQSQNFVQNPWTGQQNQMQTQQRQHPNHGWQPRQPAGVVVVGNPLALGSLHQNARWRTSINSQPTTTLGDLTESTAADDQESDNNNNNNDGSGGVDYQNDPNPDDQVNNDSSDQDVANIIEENNDDGDNQAGSSNPHEDQEERAGRRSFSEQEEEATERDAKGRPILRHRSHLINGKPANDHENDDARGGGDQNLGSAAGDRGGSASQKFDTIVKEIDQNEPYSPDYDESEAASDSNNNNEPATDTGDAESRLNRRRIVAPNLRTPSMTNITVTNATNSNWPNPIRKLKKPDHRNGKNQSRIKPSINKDAAKVEEIDDNSSDSEPERKREKHNHKLKESLTSKQWDDSTGNEPSSAGDQPADADGDDQDQSGESGSGTRREESPEETRDKMEAESKDEHVDFVDLDILSDPNDFPFMSSSSSTFSIKKRRKRELAPEAAAASTTTTTSLGPVLENVLDRIENATRRQNGTPSTTGSALNLLELTTQSEPRQRSRVDERYGSNASAQLDSGLNHEDRVEVELVAPPNESDSLSPGIDHQANDEHDDDRDALAAAGIQLDQLGKRQDYNLMQPPPPPQYHDYVNSRPVVATGSSGFANNNFHTANNDDYMQQQRANYTAQTSPNSMLAVPNLPYNYTMLQTDDNQMKFAYRNASQAASSPPSAATIGLTASRPGANYSYSSATSSMIANTNDDPQASFYSDQPEVHQTYANNINQLQKEQQPQQHNQPLPVAENFATSGAPVESVNLLPPALQQTAADLYPPPLYNPNYYQLPYGSSNQLNGNNQLIDQQVNQQHQMSPIADVIPSNPMSLGSKAYSHKKKSGKKEKKLKKFAKDEFGKKKVKKKKKKGVVKVAKSSKGKKFKKKAAAQRGSMKKRKRKAAKKMSKGFKEFKGATKGHKGKKGLGSRGAKKGTLLYKDKGYKKRGFKKAYQKLESGDHKTYFDEFRDKDHKKRWKNFKDKHQFSQNKKWAAKDKKRFDHHKLDEMKDKKSKTGAWNKNAASKHRKDYKYKGSMEKKLLNKKKKKKKKSAKKVKKKKKMEDSKYEIGVHMKG